MTAPTDATILDYGSTYYHTTRTAFQNGSKVGVLDQRRTAASIRSKLQNVSPACKQLQVCVRTAGINRTV